MDDGNIVSSEEIRTIKEDHIKPLLINGKLIVKQTLVNRHFDANKQ